MKTPEPPKVFGKKAIGEEQKPRHGTNILE